MRLLDALFGLRAAQRVFCLAGPSLPLSAHLLGSLAPTGWFGRLHPPGRTESTSKCQLASEMGALAYEVPVLPVGPPDLRGHRVPQSTKVANAFKLFLGELAEERVSGRILPATAWLQSSCGSHRNTGWHLNGGCHAFAKTLPLGSLRGPGSTPLLAPSLATSSTRLCGGLSSPRNAFKTGAHSNAWPRRVCSAVR